MDELRTLLKIMPMNKVITILAKKYNISLRPIKTVKRYTYPTVGGVIVPNVIQFKVSFKLMEHMAVTVSIPTYPNSQVFLNDARRVSVCNDDTKTFSSSFTKISTEAGYWLSTLPNFKQHYYFAVISATNLLNAHTGLLILQGDDLIFLPIVNNYLIFLYKPYSEGTPFLFLFIGENEDNAITIIKNMYLTQQNSCAYGLIKTYMN
jgi:hypothetical protein